MLGHPIRSWAAAARIEHLFQFFGPQGYFAAAEQRTAQRHQRHPSASAGQDPLIAEMRVPIPAKPGQPERYDYEYERHGTSNLFMMFAPLEGQRHVKVTDRHASVDYTQVLKDLSDTHYPQAKKIVLVQDNLSTHKPASL